MRQVGFPLERTAEEAWPDFRGWRINYERAAYGLADYLVAVPAPWSGPRSHMTQQDAYDVLAHRPRYRTPSDPDGRRVHDATALAMQRERVAASKRRPGDRDGRMPPS